MKQILFVDDKPAIGKVLSVYLGKENELVYFEDPVRAIEWLNEGNEPRSHHFGHTHAQNDRR